MQRWKWLGEWVGRIGRRLAAASGDPVERWLCLLLLEQIGREPLVKGQEVTIGTKRLELLDRPYRFRLTATEE